MDEEKKDLQAEASGEEDATAREEAQASEPAQDPELGTPETREEPKNETPDETASMPESDETTSAPAGGVSEGGEAKGPGAFGNKWVRIGVIALIGLTVIIAAWLMLRPRLVVASVNGETISRVDMLKELEAQSGRQALDNLITDMLVMQKAEAEGVAVGEEEVQKEIDTLKSQLESQGQSFDQYLASQGVDEAFMADRLRMRILIGKLVEDRVEVTEEDIDGFIDENEAQLPEDVDPSDGAFRDQVSKQLQQQKFSEVASDYVQELRSDANIEYYREY